MNWRIGASTGCCRHLAIVDVIRLLAAAGFRGVELGTLPSHFDIWRDAEVGAVLDVLRETGTDAVAIHAPFGETIDLADPDPHRRDAGFGSILRAADVLQTLGGEVVVVHATDLVRAEPDGGRRLQQACESIHLLQTACLKRGVTLAIESPLPHLIGGAPDEFARLLEAAGPDARVCLDTGHTTLANHWDAFARLAAGRLIHVHAHDNDGAFDDHKPPGDGRIDWSRIAASLEMLRFERWIMLELACPSEPVGRHFIRGAQQLRQRLDAARAGSRMF